MRRSALRRRARKGRGGCSEGWVLSWPAPLSRPHRLARPDASYPSPEYGAGEGAYGGGRRCPTCPPSNVLGYRGTPPVPPAGAAPPAPCLWGRRGRRFSPSAECGGRDKRRLLDGWSCCGLGPPSAGGLAWLAPLSRPHLLARPDPHPILPLNMGLGRGLMVADAVVPPTHPPTFLGTGGHPLHLPAEHWVPCTLLWETGVTFAWNCGGTRGTPGGVRRRPLPGGGALGGLRGVGLWKQRDRPG